MGIGIKKVRSVEDLKALGSFRYEVYVAEMQRPQRYADHARRMVIEPLDSCANVFVALDDGRIVGTVRTNYAARGDLDEYVRLFGIDSADPRFLAGTSITTKLMVAPHYRNTSLAYRLARATYRCARADGIHQDFIDVNPPLVPFFQKLGYRVHRPRVLHPEYGPVVVMRIDVHDAEHFERVGSPFFRLACEPSQVTLHKAHERSIPPPDEVSA